MTVKTNERFFDILRALACVCVVCAHSTPILTTEGVAYGCAQALDYLGTMGVPVFFMISGFMFAFNQKTLSAFWSGKLKSIVLPWFFCATLVWLYIVLRKGGISLGNWFAFVLGFGHSTYYLSVLMMLYLLFWKRTKDWALYGAVILTMVSLLTTAWVVDPLTNGDFAQFYYLNPLHWAGFFAVGVLINRKGLLQKLQSLASSPYVLCLTLLIGVSYGVLCKMNGYPCTYFSKFALVGFVANTVMLIGFATVLEKKDGVFVRLLIHIGKCSFPIYLLHQLFTGIVSAITNALPFGVLVLARPAVVIGAILCGLWIAKKLIRNSKILLLIGLRV